MSTTTFNIELNESTPEPDDYNDYFITQDEQTGEEKKLYFRYNSSNGTFNLYSSSPTQNTSVAPIISSSRSNVIWYSDADKTITIINSYTVKSSTEDAYFNFTVRVSNANRSYSLAFLRPVINFANSNTEELIRFKCNGIDL